MSKKDKALKEFKKIQQEIQRHAMMYPDKETPAWMKHELMIKEAQYRLVNYGEG